MVNYIEISVILIIKKIINNNNLNYVNSIYITSNVTNNLPKIINLVSAKFHLTIVIIIDYCLVRLD